MPDDPTALVARLRELLTQQRYSAVVIRNYCNNAEQFLHFLARRDIAVETATPADVSSYLRDAMRRFHWRHGRAPIADWKSIPRSGIHSLLRLVQGQWPPEPPSAGPAEAFCRAVCTEYSEWLREERGLAAHSITDLMWEAKHFLSWYAERSGVIGFTDIGVSDIDAYFAIRAPRLRRRSLKDTAERLRSLMRFLHRTGRTAAELAPHIIGPTLYAYEAIPSALSQEQIAAVLKTTREDHSPVGLRDYAILLLLATYGLRAGEIMQLRLEDIDWRAETLHIRHSKTGAQSLLPLLAPVGEALLAYLRCGRPETKAREVFIRTRAPYRRMRTMSQVRRRLEAAGVKVDGKRGPHAFRHARAVSLLRASIPRKIIGDLLGHRSEEATVPYLKLATEDLRAIALDIPGQEKRS